MIVQFHDKNRQPIYIDRDRGERLKLALANGTKWVDIDDCMYAASSISAIVEPDPNLHIHGMLPEQKQLVAPTTELPEEVRERNIERIRQMKRDFLEKRGKL